MDTAPASLETRRETMIDHPIWNRFWPVLLSIVIPATLSAATPKDRNTADSTAEPRYWLNAGVGASSYDIAVGASASLLNGNVLFTLRTIYNEEFQILGPSPSNSVWDIGFMAGYHRQSGYFSLSGSAGLSLVSGIRRGVYLGSSGMFSSEYGTVHFSTIGIPAEIQFFWTPFDFLGIGITAFGDLNSEESFAGALLTLRVGNLK